MREFHFIFALTLGTLLHSVALQSPAEKPAAPARADVLVLGVYHMANPGHDIFNMQADDVLAPKRQAEIAQVIGVLKRIHPTVIAIEADLLSPTNPTTNERVLVIFGYGHLAWLRQNFSSDPTIRLRKLAEFVK